MTFAIVLGGIAATWGVLKATIKSITHTLVDVKEDLTELFTRLDKLEAKQAVALSAIETMSKDILSPQILKKNAERDGAIEARLGHLERETENLHNMHNTSHPEIKTYK